MKILLVHNRKDTSQNLLNWNNVSQSQKDLETLNFFVIINDIRDLTFYLKGIAAKFCK